MDDSRGQEEYTRQVAEAYCKTPGTTGTVRRADRLGTAQLYPRGVAVSGIENAFVLAAARRPSQVRGAGRARGATIADRLWRWPAAGTLRRVKAQNVRRQSRIPRESSKTTVDMTFTARTRRHSPWSPESRRYRCAPPPADRGLP